MSGVCLAEIRTNGVAVHAVKFSCSRSELPLQVSEISRERACKIAEISRESDYERSAVSR